jgi:phage shock protein E
MAEIKTVNANDWKEKAMAGDALVIDVRTPKEFKQNGLKESLNIDCGSPAFKEIVSVLNKDKTYLIYCRSGARGEKATEIFRELGFERVYNLEGGIGALQSQTL